MWKTYRLIDGISEQEAGNYNARHNLFRFLIQRYIKSYIFFAQKPNGMRNIFCRFSLRKYEH